MISIIPKIWFALWSVNLTIQSFTGQIALLTTEITAIAIGLAALSYALGVALVSSPVTNIMPTLSEHGARLKTDSIKALFAIGMYGGITNLVTWTITLLNSIR